MSPASVNRTCFALKAALNLAARQDERSISRRAWQEGLALIPNATHDRNVILADGVVRDLITEAYNDNRSLTPRFLRPSLHLRLTTSNCLIAISVDICVISVCSESNS